MVRKFVSNCIYISLFSGSLQTRNLISVSFLFCHADLFICLRSELLHPPVAPPLVSPLTCLLLLLTSFLSVPATEVSKKKPNIKFFQVYSELTSVSSLPRKPEFATMGKNHGFCLLAGHIPSNELLLGTSSFFSGRAFTLRKES